MPENPNQPNPSMSTKYSSPKDPTKTQSQISNKTHNFLPNVTVETFKNKKPISTAGNVARGSGSGRLVSDGVPVAVSSQAQTEPKPISRP